MTYLKIRNWDKWQTYRHDRGQPPWIKIHRCIMRDPEWVSLTDSERGQLVSMWLLAADRYGTIPASLEIIQKLCFLTKQPNINRFIELNFIEDERIQDDVNLASSGSQSDQPKAEAKAEAKAKAETEVDKKIILNYALELGLPKSISKTSVDKTESVISARLKEGYSIDQLKAHLEIYVQKKKAHNLYREKHGDDPDFNDPAWCPNVKWRVAEIFGVDRLDKYYSVWEEEGFIPANSLVAKSKKRGFNGTNKKGLGTGKKFCESDGQPYPEPDEY